jgi:hypothetical protein
MLRLWLPRVTCEHVLVLSDIVCVLASRHCPTPTRSKRQQKLVFTHSESRLSAAGSSRDQDVGLGHRAANTRQVQSDRSRPEQRQIVPALCGSSLSPFGTACDTMAGEGCAAPSSLHCGTHVLTRAVSSTRSLLAWEDFGCNTACCILLEKNAMNVHFSVSQNSKLAPSTEHTWQQCERHAVNTATHTELVGGTLLHAFPCCARYNYPHLDGGVDALRRDEFGRLKDTVYVDHAG